MSPCSVLMASCVLGWGGVQTCLFRYNKNSVLARGTAVFQYKKNAVLDGAVLSFSIGQELCIGMSFSIEQDSVLGWRTVQSFLSCPKWGLGLWERFSLFFLEVISHSSRLGWNASFYCCSASYPKGGLGLWERFRLFFFDVISHSSLLIWNASVYWSMFENNLLLLQQM